MNNATFSFFTSRKKLFKNYVVLCNLMLISGLSFGQIAISSSTPVTQNFDATVTGQAVNLPSNWKMSPAGTVAPTWPAAGNFIATNISANSGSPATGGRYNWGNGTTTTDRAIGFMTSGSYANPNSIMAFYSNASGSQISDLAISFDYERYRINTAACAITFFTSTDGSTWTARTAGDSGAFTTGSNAYNFTTGTIISRSFTLTGINIPDGGNLYLRWNFNTTGGNSQGVGLDNVSVTATIVSAAVPVVTGGTLNGTVGTALTNYQISATNSPNSYAVSNGTFPAGLTLNTTTGIISGTPTTAGSSSVEVTATNGSGTSTPATLNFVIALGNQTITFGALTNRQIGDANFNLTATASSGLTVQYESSNPLVATVSGSTVTIVGAGSIDITASQPGNTNYNAATNVVRSLTVTQRQLTIVGLTGDSKVYDTLTTTTASGTATLIGAVSGDEDNVSLSGTPNFNFATATVGNNKIINVIGFVLTGSSAGNYILIQPSLTANVTAKSINVTGATASNKVYDGTTTATIVGGTLNGVEATDVANVTLASTGSFDTSTVGQDKLVTLSVSGSAAFNYSLTQPGISANITKANQTITLTTLPTLNTNSASVNLNTFASSSSGLALTYESSNPNVVSVSGNTLTVVGPGTATITASQGGDINYNSATDVTQSITVTIAPAIIAGWDFQTTANGGTALATAPNTPKQITANFGSGILYLDGTNSSSNFITATTGNELTSFAGTALNTTGTSFSTTTSGAASLALASGTNSTANGKSAVFVINMSNYSNLEISYAVQRSNTGFTSNVWQYSLDGLVWNSIGTINNIPLSFDIVTLPVTSDLNNVSTAYIRLTVNGSTGSGSNNRLDNIKFEATIIPITEVTWNGTEWSNGTGPTFEIDALLEGAYDTSAEGGFTAKSLTVSTGGLLSIGSDTNVTVVNELINNLTAAAVVIENDGSLIQQGTTNNNSGNVTFFRNSQDLMRLDYTIWSSPVDVQNLATFSPLTTSNRFYTYSTDTDIYTPIANTNGFSVGQGYLIRTPNNHPTTPTSWLGQFIGLPNSGDLTVGLSAAGQGFNLVGNPYPSPINIATFLADNNAVIAGNLYFWRKTNGIAGSAYVTFNGSTFSSGPQANNTIQPGQGFIVGATAASNLSFNNLQRVANNGTFFRNENFNQSEDNSRIWLNLLTNTSVVSQMAVGYRADATNGLDTFDAPYINDNTLALNSFEANAELAVQHRAAFETTDVVALSFKTNTAGNYSIALNAVDGLFADAAQAIFLKDNLLNLEHDLRGVPYTFVSEMGQFTNRFEIVYQSTLSLANPSLANDVVAYTQNNVIKIITATELIVSVNVYDLKGSLIASIANVNNTTASIPLSNVAKQVLVVQITTQNGVTIARKLVH